MLQADPSAKAIVFSQFTSMLDLVSFRLEQVMLLSICCLCLRLCLSVSVLHQGCMADLVGSCVAFTCNGNPVEQVANFQITWDFSHQALLRALSRQSSRRLVVLARLFNGVIHCFSVATPSACNCICCKLSWCLSYSMDVRSGGMYSPHVAAANDARAALQRLNDNYLRTICCL